MARPPRPWYWKERDGWYVTLGGQRLGLAHGKHNRRAAEDKFHELMIERDANPAPDSGRPTVVSVVEAYLAYAARRLAARNYADLRSVLQRFAEAHGYRLVTDCKAYHLTSWLDASPSFASDWTRLRVVATVKRAFNWAGRQGLVGDNPFKAVSQSAGRSRRPLTDAEFRSLLRGAPGPRGRPFRQALIFLRLTGCRPAEMASLTWSDIHWDGVPRVVLTAHKTAAKTGKPRVIPLVPVVQKLLRHLDKSTSGDRVFLNDRGNPWHRSALSLRIQRCRVRQGIPADAVLYGIRHQFGTEAIKNGVGLKAVAQLMGHQGTRTTERHYVHLDGQDEFLAENMRRATGLGEVTGGRPSNPGRTLRKSAPRVAGR
jgi:integrase